MRELPTYAQGSQEDDEHYLDVCYMRDVNCHSPAMDILDTSHFCSQDKRRRIRLNATALVLVVDDFARSPSEIILPAPSGRAISDVACFGVYEALFSEAEGKP